MDTISPNAPQPARADKGEAVQADGRDWFLTVFNPPLDLAIIGAVHIAQALIPMAKAAGYDVTKVLTTDDLFAGDDGFFSMTAITDGDFLRGVRYFDFGAITHSMVVRAKTGTVRTIETIHRHDKNASFSTAGL